MRNKKSLQTNVLLFTGIVGLILSGCTEKDPDIPIPIPPSDLSAAIISDQQIDLSWTDNSDNESGFVLERKTATEEYSVITTTAVNVSTYSDKYLDEDIEYSYRVFAINTLHEIGDYSNEAVASTHGKPELETGVPGAITPFAASLEVSVTDVNGSPLISKGVVWGLDADPTIDLSTRTEEGPEPGSYTSQMIGLNWDTEYHVRSYATNAVGTAYGYDQTFRTEQISISTLEVTKLNHKHATSGGTIDGEGGTSILERGVVWNTVASPAADLLTKTVDGGNSGDFTSSVTGLLPNTAYYIRSYARNNLNTSYGPELTFTTRDVVYDIEGNDYSVVEIGSQLWLGENLRATRDNNDSELPEIIGDSEWINLTSPGYSWYNNSETVRSTYGALYNGYTVSMDICPAGWQIPSMNDMGLLIYFLGGDFIAGGKLKDATTEYWASPNLGASNESGFTAVGSGYRSHDGLIVEMRRQGSLWTTSEVDADIGEHLFIGYDENIVIRGESDKNYGYAVRCVKELQN